MKKRKLKRLKGKKLFASQSSDAIENILHQATFHYQAGRLDDALRYYQQALSMNPHRADIHNDIGTVFHAQDFLDIASSFYQSAITLDQNHADALYNLGNIFSYQGKRNEAAHCFRKTLQIKPNNPEALNNLGALLRDQERENRDFSILNEALSCCQRAVEIKPNFAEGFHNLGTIFETQGKSDAAVDAYLKAIALNPNLSATYLHLGLLFNEQKKPEYSIPHLKKATQLRPHLDKAWLGLFKAFQQTCQWDELDSISKKLDDWLQESLQKKRPIFERTFTNISRKANPELNFLVARTVSEETSQRMAKLKIKFPFNQKRIPDKKIKLGYASYDFRNHPVAHQVRGLFKLHNRSDFTVHCYSYGFDDKSDYRAQIKADCDSFVDLQHHSSLDAARRINEDKIDILIDLSGYTDGGRPEIFALRPSPLQLSYIIPMTTGARFMDYFIADKIVLPKGHRPYFSEKTILMPHCYMITDNTQEISDNAWEKKKAGLPEESFVFCSFNAVFKIEPIIFACWMSILKKVPNSVLWLSEKNSLAMDNLKKEASKKGIDPERILFAQKVPQKNDYLARLKLADLVLDTPFFNGHVTTCDALWAGVPVLSIEGEHFASRVSASLMESVGMPELIVNDLEEYEKFAVHLANTPDAIKSLRLKLEKNLLTEPLFDTALFVQYLELAYKEIWKLYCAGEKPRHIEVI